MASETRRIRLSVALHTAGESLYEPLPVGWDTWTQQQRENYLSDLEGEMTFELVSVTAEVIAEGAGHVG